MGRSNGRRCLSGASNSRTMHRWAGALLLFTILSGFTVLGSPVYAQSASSAGRAMVVSTERAQVRELPHTAAAVAATLSKGSVVFELRRVGTWIEVRGQKERIGWIEAPNLTLAPAPDSLPEVSSPGVSTLSAMAIAALIVQASRSAYYASGRPCACPDDRTRTGRRCGANSAYSRPGGAQPLCYPSDVPAERIDEYKAKLKRASSP